MTVLEGVRETLIKHIPYQGVDLFTRLHDLPTKTTGLPEGTLLLGFSYFLHWNLPFLALLLSFFCCCAEGTLSCRLQPIKAGTSRHQELTTVPHITPTVQVREKQSTHAHCPIHFLYLCTVQNPNPGNSAARGRLVLPTSVRVKDHPAQTHTQPRNPFLRLSTQVTLYYVKLTK